MTALLSNNLFRYLSFLFIFCLWSFLDGCVSPACRMHPEFELRARSIERPLLMPPDVKIYESLPGGMTILRDDWSALGQANLGDAVLKTFREKNCEVKMLDPYVSEPEEIEAIQSVYKAVNKSIRLQAYGPQSASEDQRSFAYSIGPIKEILLEHEADSMIFVCGLERVSKAGSRAIVNLAVADPSGTIIWYSVEGSRGDACLSDTDNTEKLVKDLIGSFPEVGG